MIIQRIPHALFGLLILSLLPGCSGGSTNGESVKKKGLVVINVLDQAEYDDCHIPGSVNVPFVELKKFADEYDTEHSEIVVYCTNYMCKTSEFACKQLIAMGFKKVLAYEGGMADWVQQGLPVEGACKLEYLRQKVSQPTQQTAGVGHIVAQELKEKMMSGGIAKW